MRPLRDLSPCKPPDDVALGVQPCVAFAIAFETGPITPMIGPTVTFENRHLSQPGEVRAIRAESMLKNWHRDAVVSEQIAHSRLKHAVGRALAERPIKQGPT